MHLDHDKFFDLLVENSGMTVEKAQKQLNQLITEMKAAFDEDEAYEIDGFGIFSKLGSNVLFIPAEELETEINYKYVGMEPIELPGSAEDSPELPENPIQGIMGGSAQEQEYEDPFEALLNGKDDESEDSIEEVSLDDDNEEAIIDEIQQELSEEESQEAKDDDILNEFFGDETEEEAPETEPLVEAIEALSDEEDKEEEFAELEEDPFGNLTEEGNSEAASENEDEDLYKPGPKEWGIDAHKEEGQENVFSGLMGDAKENNDDEIVFNSDSNDDNPFSELEDSSDSKEDFIPVVTNVSSEAAKKEKKDALDEVLNSKDPTAKTPKRKNATAAIINVLLLVIILVSGGYLLTYFDVIHIEGITKGTTKVTERTTPQQNKEKLSEAFDKLSAEMQEKMQQGTGVTSPEADIPDTKGGVDKVQAMDANKPKTSVSKDVKEQELPKVVKTTPTSNAVSSTTTAKVSNTNSGTPTGIAEYGLNGSVNEAANSGYTIVLYTLSKKEGVDRAIKKLEAQGLRVLIKESPSTKYGVLYRVSVGQFRTLVDAATAVEENKKMFSENYSITKIK